MGNLDRTLQPIPAAVNRHDHRQPEQLEFAAARGKANHQASGLWAVVCGDDGADESQWRLHHTEKYAGGALSCSLSGAGLVGSRNRQTLPIVPLKPKFSEEIHKGPSTRLRSHYSSARSCELLD